MVGGISLTCFSQLTVWALWLSNEMLSMLIMCTLYCISFCAKKTKKQKKNKKNRSVLLLIWSRKAETKCVKNCVVSRKLKSSSPINSLSVLYFELYKISNCNSISLQCQNKAIKANISTCKKKEVKYHTLNEVVGHNPVFQQL